MLLEGPPIKSLCIIFVFFSWFELVFLRFKRFFQVCIYITSFDAERVNDSSYFCIVVSVNALIHVGELFCSAFSTLKMQYDQYAAHQKGTNMWQKPSSPATLELPGCQLVRSRPWPALGRVAGVTSRCKQRQCS